MDKAQNLGMSENMYKTANAEAEKMDILEESLLQKMEEQREKLESFEQPKSDSALARLRIWSSRKKFNSWKINMKKSLLWTKPSSTADKEVISQENHALH